MPSPNRAKTRSTKADTLQIQTTWVVMLFGVGIRPHISCSTDVSLAYTAFLQSMRLLMPLAREVDFRMAGDDVDGALSGLSLYMNDALVLSLQPAATIIPHMEPGTKTWNVPFDSFEQAAPMLLAAMKKRSKYTDEDAEKVGHSAVAYAFARDVDDEMIKSAATELSVKDRFPAEQVERLWEQINTARTMMQVTATIS